MLSLEWVAVKSFLAAGAGSGLKGQGRRSIEVIEKDKIRELEGKVDALCILDFIVIVSFSVFLDT